MVHAFDTSETEAARRSGMHYGDVALEVYIVVGVVGTEGESFGMTCLVQDLRESSRLDVGYLGP
jgi:hypothetical protein